MYREMIVDPHIEVELLKFPRSMELKHRSRLRKNGFVQKHKDGPYAKRKRT